jgi:hypothetical protein
MVGDVNSTKLFTDVKKWQWNKNNAKI